MDKPFTITLPWPGKPKARPIVTENGTYMPPDYTEWKENVAEFMAYMNHRVKGPVKLELEFAEKAVTIRVIPIAHDWMRDKNVRGDIDNLIGGIMDALQDARLYNNDNQVVAVEAWIKRRMDG